MVAMIERDKKKSWNIKDRMVKTSDDDTPENR